MNIQFQKGTAMKVKAVVLYEKNPPIVVEEVDLAGPD